MAAIDAPFRLHSMATQCPSLSDTKVPENHIQELLDAHRAGDAADGAHGHAQILGGERHFGGRAGPLKGGACFGQRLAVTGAPRD